MKRKNTKLGTIKRLIVTLLIGISLFPLHGTKDHKKKLFNENTESFQILLDVQKELRCKQKKIREKIQSNYQPINNLISQLKDIERTHQTILEIEQMIGKTKEKLHIKKESTERCEKCNEALSFATRGLNEIEKARKIIDKETKRIEELLNKLFGTADGIFHKAHITQAQKNIEKAAKLFNEALNLKPKGE